MNCRDTSFVHAYADRELDLTQSLEMEQHLQDCGRCALELQNQQILKTALGNPQLYYSAPEELRRQVAAVSRRLSPGSGRFHWNVNWLFAIPPRPSPRWFSCSAWLAGNRPRSSWWPSSLPAMFAH